MLDVNAFKKLFPALTVSANVPLSELTTFHLGGPAPYVIFCATSQQLKDVVRFLCSSSVPDYVVIGEGSNLLVSDQGIEQIVIRFFSQKPYFHLNGNEVVAEAGSRLDDLAFFCVQNGLSGLGFASGIPGTVGGAVVGNAGAFGQQISQAIKAVEILDSQGQAQTLAVKDCDFAYRQSRFKDSKEILLSAVFKLTNDAVESLHEEREMILAMRKNKHPDHRNVPCAGSFFKNIAALNPGDRRQAAGLFLDQIGGKKMAVGGAGVFEKHANILIKKTKSCTAQDVFTLSQNMEKAVLKKFGIVLEREVRLMGNFN